MTPPPSMARRREPSWARGAINNRMTNLLMQMLEHRGVPTHFVQELNERETVVKKK